MREEAKQRKPSMEIKGRMAVDDQVDVENDRINELIHLKFPTINSNDDQELQDSNFYDP